MSPFYSKFLSITPSFSTIAPTLLASSLFFYIVLKQIRKWASGTRVPLNVLKSTKYDSKHDVALITGANTGIGFETAKYLALLNTRVIITCRSEKKLASTLDALKEACSGTPHEEWNKLRRNGSYAEPCIEGVVMELGSLDSVKEAANKIQSELLSSTDKLRVFIQNAGYLDCEGGLTQDGYENMFQINYLSHFLLTQLLMDRIERDATRVVQVSSRAHTRFPHMTIKYDKLTHGPPASNCLTKTKVQFEWYAHSKLAQVLFMRRLDRLFKEKCSKATAFAVHPGVVRSSFQGGMPWILSLPFKILGQLTVKNSEEGAQTSVYCAINENIPEGEYYSDCVVEKRHALSDNSEAVDELYNRSMEMIDKWL